MHDEVNDTDKSNGVKTGLQPIIYSLWLNPDVYTLTNWSQSNILKSFHRNNTYSQRRISKFWAPLRKDWTELWRGG